MILGDRIPRFRRLAQPVDRALRVGAAIAGQPGLQNLGEVNHRRRVAALRTLGQESPASDVITRLVEFVTIHANEAQAVGEALHLVQVVMPGSVARIEDSAQNHLLDRQLGVAIGSKRQAGNHQPA